MSLETPPLSLSPSIRFQGSPTPLPLPSDPANDSPSQVPPDGGLEAWAQVFGAFFVFWNIWYLGILYSM